MNQSEFDVLEFAVVMTREIEIGQPMRFDWREICDYLKSVLDLARRHNELCKIDVDYELSVGEWYEREELRRKIEAIALAIGVTAEFSNDTRGHTVKFKMPSGINNDWNNEYWCVPKS